METMRRLVPNNHVFRGYRYSTEKSLELSDGRCSVKKILWCSLMLLTVCGSAETADKIRIAVPEPNAAYMTFPLAHKKGFLTNAGLHSRGHFDGR